MSPSFRTEWRTIQLISLGGEEVETLVKFVNLLAPHAQGPVKVLALPHGRATEQAEAQVSSPTVSKGCASRQLSYGTLTGPWSDLLVGKAGL